MEELIQRLVVMKDSRQEWKVKHKLADIVAIVLRTVTACTPILYGSGWNP